MNIYKIYTDNENDYFFSCLFLRSVYVKALSSEEAIQKVSNRFEEFKESDFKVEIIEDDFIYIEYDD